MLNRIKAGDIETPEQLKPHLTTDWRMFAPAGIYTGTPEPYYYDGPWVIQTAWVTKTLHRKNEPNITSGSILELKSLDWVLSPDSRELLKVNEVGRIVIAGLSIATDRVIGPVQYLDKIEAIFEDPSKETGVLGLAAAGLHKILRPETYDEKDVVLLDLSNQIVEIERVHAESKSHISLSDFLELVHQRKQKEQS